MKFYKIRTNLTQTEIDKIVYKMTLVESEEIDKIFNNIKVVEYTDEHGKESMFAILSNLDLHRVSKIYDKYSISFEIEDLSKEVLFDLPIHTKYRDSYNRSMSLKIRTLIKKYKREFTTVDTVLDKILELGIKSLTDFDYSVLKSH